MGGSSLSRGERGEPYGDDLAVVGAETLDGIYWGRIGFRHHALSVSYGLESQPRMCPFRMGIIGKRGMPVKIW
jgi:hypothetical protein